MRFILLYALSCFGILQAANNHGQMTSAYPAETRYLASSKRFSIPVPTGWRNSPGENLGLRDNAFLHPKAFGGFTANVVFIEEPTLGLKNLQDLVSASIANMRDVPGFKIVQTQPLKTADGENIVAIRYEGHFIPNGPLSNNIVYFIKLKEERLLTITVSGIKNTPESCHEEAKAAVLKIELSK